jgi:hypothetical protein
MALATNAETQSVKANPAIRVLRTPRASKLNPAMTQTPSQCLCPIARKRTKAAHMSTARYMAMREWVEEF